MKTKLAFNLHLMVWTISCLILVIPMFTGGSASKPEAITVQIIATLFWIAVYYFFFLYLTPNFLLAKNLTAFFGYSILVLLVLPFFGYTLLFLVKALFSGSFSEFYKGYGIAMHFSGLKALAVAGLTGTLFKMISEYCYKPAV
jgi:hypothetical protein